MSCAPHGDLEFVGCHPLSSGNIKGASRANLIKTLLSLPDSPVVSEGSRRILDSNLRRAPAEFITSTVYQITF